MQLAVSWSHFFQFLLINNAAIMLKPKDFYEKSQILKAKKNVKLLAIKF